MSDLSGFRGRRTGLAPRLVHGRMLFTSMQLPLPGTQVCRCAQISVEIGDAQLRGAVVNGMSSGQRAGVMDRDCGVARSRSSSFAPCHRNSRARTVAVTTLVIPMSLAA
jgi:hypothetical protein